MNRAEKMEQALGEIGNACAWIAENCNDMQTAKYMWVLIERVKAALTVPKRNCDVGTAEEQFNRFYAFCKAKRNCDYCDLCEIKNRVLLCEFAWAQMPYESDVS